MALRDVFIVFCLLALVSCTSIEDCQNDPNRSFVILRFQHDDIVAFDSITVNNLNRLEGDTDTLTGLGVFIDPNLTQSLFTFYTDSTDYQLEISYQTQVQIFEIDCDPSMYVYDLDTIRQSFDSLSIQQTILTNYNLNGDLTIYF